MFFIFLFLSLSLFFIFFFNKHYLFILLFFEILLFMVYTFFSLFYLNVFNLMGIMIFLMILVCMGAFSISLLIGISRVSGHDFWKFFFIY